MLNAMRMWSAWFALSSQAVLLGFEAQAVMALRLVRLAGGGATARSEASRMYTEKVQALGGGPKYGVDRSHQGWQRPSRGKEGLGRL